MELTINPGRSPPPEKDEEGWTPRESKPPRERPVGKCPVCRREQVKLDFHHWDYTNDIGCRICRECHRYAHQPEGCRPGEVAGNGWIPNCFSRLMVRYREHHGWVSEHRVFQQLSIPHKHRNELSEILSGENDE